MWRQPTFISWWMGALSDWGRGPRENMARPAIDPLFRSAGISAVSSAIGVLLSGMLNDGASGLADLKRCGGVTVVQSPLDTVESEMPRTALLASDIDYRAPAGDLAALLKPPREGRARPRHDTVAHEVAIAIGLPSDTPTITEIADPVPLNSPGCGGTLSQIKRSPLRFRCQVGHGYTAEALAYEQEGSVDEAVRMAVRVIGSGPYSWRKWHSTRFMQAEPRSTTFQERADEER